MPMLFLSKRSVDTNSDPSRVRSLAHTLLACVGLALVGVVPAVHAQVPATDPSSASDLAYERQDLVFILDQIEIAEEHVRRGGDCQSLREIIPSALLPWGLRAVDGSCNNLMPHGEDWGAADVPFPDTTPREYRRAQEMKFDPLAENDVTGAQTSYARGEGQTVVDSHPRLISQLVAQPGRGRGGGGGGGSRRNGDRSRHHGRASALHSEHGA